MNTSLNWTSGSAPLHNDGGDLCCNPVPSPCFEFTPDFIERAEIRESGVVFVFEQMPGGIVFRVVFKGFRRGSVF